MTQRPATVIAAIALKYALHEAHLSESEIGFFWMQRRQDTRRRPRKLPRQNPPNANPRTIIISHNDRYHNYTNVATIGLCHMGAPTPENLPQAGHTLSDKDLHVVVARGIVELSGRGALRA